MIRFVLVALGLLAAFTVLFLWAQGRGWLEPAFVEARLAALSGSPGGRLAVAAAVVALLVGDIVLPVPSSVVMALSGKLLGVVAGSLASLLGAMLSCALAFFACRWGSARFARRIAGSPDTERLRAWFEARGVYAVILSRPVPMLTEILSCLAGMSAMRARVFLAAAFLGTAPVCLVYGWAGSRGRLDDPWPLVAVALLVPAAGWLLVRVLTRRRA